MTKRQAINAPKDALIALVDIAEMAGVTRQRAHQLASSATFPEPQIETRSGRLWSKAAVAAWLRARR
jgi:predicted DNA-binding transcriptional regulator AlpA